MLKSTLKKLYEKITRSKLFEWVVIHILSKIRLPFKRGVSDKCYSDIRKYFIETDDTMGIKYACCFVATDKWKLSSFLVRWLTGGSYSHAGMLWYVVEEDRVYSLHADIDGVKFEYLKDMLSHYTDYALCLFELKDEAIPIVEGRVKYLIDNRKTITYDFAQEVGYKAMYCSELCMYVLRDVTQLDYTDVSGKLIVTPQGVIDKATYFKKWSVKDEG